MKRKILIEIEYPEGSDYCWDTSVSGHQAFHDAVITNAISGATLSLGRNTEGMSVEDKRRLSDLREREANVIMSCKSLGYIGDDGILNMLSDNRCEFDKKYSLTSVESDTKETL